MKDHFMASYHLTSKTTIDEFRKDLKEYVVKYNNQVHSELNATPNDIFFKKENLANIIYKKKEEIDKLFLLEIDTLYQ